jgi:mannitol operon transcriptional antiterminator
VKRLELYGAQSHLYAHSRQPPTVKDSAPTYIRTFVKAALSDSAKIWPILFLGGGAIIFDKERVGGITVLASRPRAILRTLVTSNHPIKIQDLANRFRVSSRTVKYDLEAIRDFLKTKGIELHSRPNIGLWVGDASNERDALSQLFSSAGRYESALSRPERINYISLWLLLRDGYMTLASIADELLVSRNTVIADMKHVEDSLKQWDVSMDRQLRMGLQVRAGEFQRRRAAEYTALNLLDSSDMFQVVQHVLGLRASARPSQKLVNIFLLDENTLETVLETVARFAEEAKTVGTFLADKDIIGVFTRVCVLTSRIFHADRQELNLDESIVASVRQAPIFQPIKKMLDTLSDRLTRPLSSEEALHVTLYFMNEWSEPTLALSLTQQLIDGVSEHMHVSFQLDSDLYDNLAAHIHLSLAKMRHGVPEPNPLCSDIRRDYDELFTSVQAVSLDLFRARGIHVADSDVAYLVLHFAAAYKRIVGRMRYKVLVVCSTGRGNARYLKDFFESEIRQVDVVQCCAVNEVEYVLERQIVDLVVTALPIDISCRAPVVRVGVLPSESDVVSVYSALSHLKRPECYASDTKDTHGESDGGFILPQDVLQSLEVFNHDIITRGFELSHLVVERFRHNLSDEGSVGLTLHILLMVNRLAFDTAYNYPVSISTVWQDEAGSLRDGLQELMRERNIDIPDAELDAMLKYFRES